MYLTKEQLGKMVKGLATNGADMVCISDEVNGSGIGSNTVCTYYSKPRIFSMPEEVGREDVTDVSIW